jgi:hypothetical protein
MPRTRNTKLMQRPQTASRFRPNPRLARRSPSPDVTIPMIVTRIAAKGIQRTAIATSPRVNPSVAHQFRGADPADVTVFPPRSTALNFSNSDLPRMTPQLRHVPLDRYRLDSRFQRLKRRWAGQIRLKRRLTCHGLGIHSYLHTPKSQVPRIRREDLFNHAPQLVGRFELISAFDLCRDF